MQPKGAKTAQLSARSRVRGAEGAPLRGLRGLPSLITSLRLRDDRRSDKEKR